MPTGATATVVPVYAGDHGHPGFGHCPQGGGERAGRFGSPVIGHQVPVVCGVTVWGDPQRAAPSVPGGGVMGEGGPCVRQPSCGTAAERWVGFEVLGYHDTVVQADAGGLKGGTGPLVF
ncbi:hypothetical protein NW775_23955, partial [Escherichia coli]|uniref:hypothetical protein n=1 Tax=Escherichia coli TaxID=562 RepID=UPI0023B1CF82